MRSGIASTAFRYRFRVFIFIELKLVDSREILQNNDYGICVTALIQSKKTDFYRITLIEDLLRNIQIVAMQVCQYAGRRCVQGVGMQYIAWSQMVLFADPCIVFTL
eukprot:gb/GECG01011599.1/.p1 GENE.gb/GECG01011599.1/~~gb/GECG01011599.1/.p1  ORF type:complete len:106 (+),score=2.03 gb/GECG01011599.1/:1-318(+)